MVCDVFIVDPHYCTYASPNPFDIILSNVFVQAVRGCKGGSVTRETFAVFMEPE